MAIPYKHYLVIGATAGIGAEIADRLVQMGAKVTAVGRRQDRLNEFVKKHGGGDNVHGEVFDISQHEQIPEFAAEMTKKYPDIDAIFLNAGVQNMFSIADPKEFDVAKFKQEMDTNFLSAVSLSQAFMPHLLAKSDAGTPAAYFVTGTNISHVPIKRLPAYSCSKVALNAFTHILRQSMKDVTKNLKVFEISPPPVQTELHDYMGDRGRAFGMPANEFIDQVFAQLQEGKDEVIVGLIGNADDFNEQVSLRRKQFDLANGGH